MEAQWLVEDPLYGCAGIISQLQEEIQPTQCELTRTRAQLAIVLVHGAQLQGSTAALPPPQPQRDDGQHVLVAQMQGQGQGKAVPLLDRPGRRPPRPRRAWAEAGRGGDVT